MFDIKIKSQTLMNKHSPAGRKQCWDRWRVKSEALSAQLIHPSIRPSADDECLTSPSLPEPLHSPSGSLMMPFLSDHKQDDFCGSWNVRAGDCGTERGEVWLSACTSVWIRVKPRGHPFTTLMLETKGQAKNGYLRGGQARRGRDDVAGRLKKQSTLLVKVHRLHSTLHRFIKTTESFEGCNWKRNIFWNSVLSWLENAACLGLEVVFRDGLQFCVLR